MKPPVADWFHNAIVDGVMLLHSLCLDGRPAAEVVTLTATGWIEVLWRGGVWRQATDDQRLQAAFFGLARAVENWPAPRQLLDHLPAAPPALAITEAAPVLTAERRAALAALHRRLADRLLSSPQMRAVRPDTSGQGLAPDGGLLASSTAQHQADADHAGRNATP